MHAPVLLQISYLKCQTQEEGDFKNRGIEISLNINKEIDNDIYNKVTGDVLLYSNDEISQEINPVVVDITLLKTID